MQDIFDAKNDKIKTVWEGNGVVVVVMNAGRAEDG